jgi:hypothetical protein
MKLSEVRSRAKAAGIKTFGQSKEALVRAIQRTEGNRDCFNRGESQTCGQIGCAWRADCK